MGEWPCPGGGGADSRGSEAEARRWVQGKGREQGCAAQACCGGSITVTGEGRERCAVAAAARPGGTAAAGGGGHLEEVSGSLVKPWGRARGGWSHREKAPRGRGSLSSLSHGF